MPATVTTKPGKTIVPRKHGNEQHTDSFARASDIPAAVSTYLRDNPPHVEAGVQLGETSVTAHRGDHGKTAYDHSQTTHSPADANNYVHPASHAPEIITQDVNNRFVTDTEKGTWNGKQDALGFTPVNTTDARLSDARIPLAHNHTGVYEPANANIQTHVGSAHAPSTAQKNSDITKAEIEAKLTGAITTHTHTSPDFGSVYRTLMEASGSHSATKVANTYGLGHGSVAAVTGTGTLYPLAIMYINSVDFPTVDGKAPKLRVRFNIFCNDVAPFTGTFVCGLHPVTRPATSGGAALCIYTIGTAVSGSTVTGTNLTADSANGLVGADFALPANGFYVLAIVTSATMATSAHVHIFAQLQMHNA